MDFSHFLSEAQTPGFWSKSKRYCFVGSSYSLGFFNTLFDIVQKRGLLSAPYQRLFIDTIDRKALYATLNQSILGIYSFFWLGNVTEEKASKSLQELHAMLFACSGPNILAFFMYEDSPAVPKKDADVIYLKDELNYVTFDQLLQFLGVSLDAKKRMLVKKLFSNNTTITLDVCCMIVTYLELINSKYVDDYEGYIASLVGALPTLSQLSELFLAKNSTQFFALWSTLGKEYSDIFWVTFWAELLWRAQNVVFFMRKKDFVQAKRMSFRLPYSFINRDWQKTDPQELTQAYAFLYNIDYAIKTGSTFYSLDLFYMNYFTNFFASTRNVKVSV